MENLISIRDSLEKIAEEIKKDRDDLYQELLMVCEEIDSLFSYNDDYSWPMSIKDFCKLFDMNRNTVNSKKKYLIKGKDCFIQDSGPDRALCFQRSGAFKLFEHSRSEKGTRYLRKYGLSLSPKEEYLYINTIKYAVSGFEIPKKEFLIKILDKKYYIDLYLQNAKIAIECDEHGHYYQEYSDELREREEDIFKELGCKFLRFNPQKLDFNVGEVINVIFHHIFNKLINGKDPIDYYMEKRKRTIRERSSPISPQEELALFK